MRDLLFVEKNFVLFAKPWRTLRFVLLVEINLRFYPFWSVFSLLSPVIRQQVTCIYFKINQLKNEKKFPVITGKTGQNAQKGLLCLSTALRQAQGPNHPPEKVGTSWPSATPP
jgi:hypothetical protein